MTTTAEPVHIDEHWDIVDSTITRIWRRYAEYVEFEDLRQEAAVWWYSKGQKHLAEYLLDEGEYRLRRSIWRYVEAYASAQKAARVGYHPRDQYPYHPREVLDLIPIALDPDGLPIVGHQDGPAPHGNLAEGGDTLAALVDVRKAIDALSEDDLYFLTLADDCSYDWERVATRVGDGVLADSLRRRHARIAERMARWLSNTEDQP